MDKPEAVCHSDQINTVRRYRKKIEEIPTTNLDKCLSKQYRFWWNGSYERLFIINSIYWRVSEPRHEISNNVAFWQV